MGVFLLASVRVILLSFFSRLHTTTGFPASHLASQAARGADFCTTNAYSSFVLALPVRIASMCFWPVWSSSCHAAVLKNIYAHRQMTFKILKPLGDKFLMGLIARLQFLNISA